MGFSRILICGPVMISVLGCPEIPPAPSPMPANYGHRYWYWHSRDMVLMAIMHGIEWITSEWMSYWRAQG